MSIRLGVMVQIFCTESAKKGTFYTGAQPFNNLPPHLKEVASTVIFKTLLNNITFQSSCKYFGFFQSLNLRSHIILSFYPSTLYMVFTFFLIVDLFQLFFPLIVNFLVAQGTHLKQLQLTGLNMLSSLLLTLDFQMSAHAIQNLTFHQQCGKSSPARIQLLNRYLQHNLLHAIE